MRLTCSLCEETFIKPHPAMLILAGNGIYYFCTVRCRDNFDLRSAEDRRCGVERRQFEQAEHNGTERRILIDRRCGGERRKGGIQLVKKHLQNPQLDENGVREKVFEDKSCQTCCYAYLRKYHQDANKYEACSMGMIPIQEWLPDNWACNIYKHQKRD